MVVVTKASVAVMTSSATMKYIHPYMPIGVVLKVVRKMRRSSARSLSRARIRGMNTSGRSIPVQLNSFTKSKIPEQGAGDQKRGML